MILGFDVSHHQDPARFDWEKLSEMVSFVYARASYGARTADKRYAEFSRRCVASGVPFGPYLFYRQIHSVEEQLALFDRQVASGKPPALLPTLDMEENAANGDGRPNPAVFGPACRKIAEALRERFGGCVLYYSAYFPEWLGAPRTYEHWNWTKEPGYLHWIADYNRDPGSPRHPYTVEWHLHQPKPKATTLYANGTAPVDHDYIAERWTLDLFRVQPPAVDLSAEAIEGEHETTERPGGALPEDVEEGLITVRDGLLRVAEGIGRIIP